METPNIFTLVILCYFISAVTSQSAIKETMGYSKATHLLSTGKTYIIAIKSSVTYAYINYTFVDGNEVIHNDGCNSCNYGSQWLPLLVISKESIRRPFDKKVSPVPAKDSLLGGRSLTVSSRENVSWQLIPPPFTDDALRVIYKEQEEYVDLPEAETVFVALWNRHERKIQIHFRFQYGEYITVDNQEATAEKGWSIICVNRNNLVYENLNFNKDNRGRRLWMYVYEDVHYQVFAMPLKPKDIGNPDEEGTDDGETQPNDTSAAGAALFIPIAVLVTYVVLVALYSGCRFFLRKRNGTEQEGTPVIVSNPHRFSSDGTSPEEHFGSVVHPDPPRPMSSHDSENSLYGAIIVR